MCKGIFDLGGKCRRSAFCDFGHGISAQMVLLGKPAGKITGKSF